MILDTEQWTCTLPLARPLAVGAVDTADPVESADSGTTSAASSHTCIAPRGGHSANFCVCAGRPAVYIFGGRDFQEDGGEFRHFGRNDACVLRSGLSERYPLTPCLFARHRLRYLLYLDAPKREELSAYGDGSFSLA